MTIEPATAFSMWLSSPVRADGLAGVAEAWRDVDVTLTLFPVVSLDTGFGAHLRRSFLGSLTHGASSAARSGRPCNWDPPCALDIFLREQLRVGGDGLPKPYVLFWWQDGQTLTVTLRVFGTACDWAPAAAEGLVAGLGSILPWAKAVAGQPKAPEILNRRMTSTGLTEVSEGPLTLRFLSPMDDEGANPGASGDDASRLLSRAIRRVDALARWQGQAMGDEVTRALTASAREIRARALRLTCHRRDSPNQHGQARVTQVVTGEIDLPPLSFDLRLLLSLAGRCHLGRHTNEGLGSFEVVQSA